MTLQRAEPALLDPGASPGNTLECGLPRSSTMKEEGHSSCCSVSSPRASTPQYHQFLNLQQVILLGDKKTHVGLGGSASILHNRSEASPLKMPMMYSSRSIANFSFDFKIAAAA
jgi:hypothetical protein